MIKFNINRKSEEEKKSKSNYASQSPFITAENYNPTQKKVPQQTSSNITEASDTISQPSENKSNSNNYSQKIKNLVNPENEVKTRNFALKYAEGNGFNISDEDISFKDGNVFIRGVNIGKPDRVDENGVSYMSQSRIKNALDNIKSTQGNGVNGYDAQYDRAINQNLSARDSQLNQNSDMAGKVFDWYRTDPLDTAYGKQVMSTYKALGDDDASNIAASAGSGANMDSASLASMTAAREARKLAAINAVTSYWAAAGEGQRSVMNDTQNNLNNYVSVGTDFAGSIGDNKRADADLQNQTNEMDSKISGSVPLDVERRNNGFFYKDPTTGAYKLYYGGENADYSALANEAEANGDIASANRLRDAAEQKALTNANYAGMINSLVPSQRADNSDTLNSNIAQTEAQKDRDFQKEIMQLEADLNSKLQNDEISKEYLDNIFRIAYEDAASGGNSDRLRSLAQWMNSHGYSVPDII